MPRMPLVPASLLAVAIALAGCGDDKNAPAQSAAPASQQSAPAAAASDGARSRAVVRHYGDLAAAIFGDALSTARELQAAGDAFLAAPTRPPWTPPGRPGWPPACPTCRPRCSASATRTWTSGKVRSTPGRWTRA